MRISHKYKFVFIAIPRTGSTSLRSVLNEVSDINSVYKYQANDENPFYHHISALEIKNIFADKGWDWDSYTKFCVVRNPFDRSVSLYHHRIDTQSRVAPGKPAIYNILRGLKYKLFYNKTFAQWLGSKESNQGLSRSVKSFTFDAEGNCLVDKFIRFEHLDDEFDELARELGFNAEVSQIDKQNKTQKRVEYRSYYDSDTRKQIEDRYRFEIDTFGYEF